MDASLASLLRRAEENLQGQELYARLLSLNRPVFSPAEIESFARDCGLPEEAAYGELLAARCGLQCDLSAAHRRLKDRYLLPAIHCLDAQPYRQNPYARLIRLPEKVRGNWRLTHLSYAPYQLFPCGDTQTLPDGREIQPLGYFREPYRYPAVLEKGREWMALIPNEMETMAGDLSALRGHVAVLGLGLGYFALMASEKKDVSAVTVIERDAQILSLFRETLLPQFPRQEKIRLVEGDALEEYSRTLTADHFDFVYADLWHDAGDGLPLYLRCRAMENRVPGPRFAYWIEPTLLCFLRGLILEELRAGNGPLADGIRRQKAEGLSWEEVLSPASLRALAPKIRPKDVMP